MLKDLSKKSRIILLTILLVTILSVVGLTYAYFSRTQVSGNTSNNNIVIETAEPGEIVVTYFNDKNTINMGSVDLPVNGDNVYDYLKFKVSYAGETNQKIIVHWKDVTNTFCQYTNGGVCSDRSADLYVADEVNFTTYECDNETHYNVATNTVLTGCTAVSDLKTPMPKTDETTSLLNTTSTILSGEKYYIVVAEVTNKETPQNYNQNKIFIGKTYVSLSNIVYFDDAELIYLDRNALGYKILIDPNVAKSITEPTLEKAAVSSDYFTANSLSLDNYVTNENGLFQTEDDDGKTYFYRGHVERNYVSFAGFIWRIVRINGDGSIRIVLAGLTSTVKKNDPANTLCTTGCAGSNVKYNNTSDTGTGPSNVAAEEATALEYASYDNGNLEGAINLFYETYIYNEANSIDYRDYLADSIFCSDTSWGNTNSGGTIWYFAPYTRLASGTSALECGTNYRYKVANGTGKLDYPIAALSIDEMNYAGALGFSTNKNYYLYNSVTVTKQWWTMSPSSWGSSGNVDTFCGIDLGRVSSYGVNYSFGVRPVVNLKADTLTTTGIGTSEDPYQVG